MQRIYNIILISIFIIGIVVFFLIEPFDLIMAGWGKIITHPGVLISDYLRIGGLIPTLLNVWVTTFLSVFLFRILNVRFTGSIIAGLLTIAGFAFFGKTPLNVLPIWIGLFLYAWTNKQPAKNYIVIMMFATGIAPIVSYLLFGAGFQLIIAIPLALFVGILTGYVIPPLSTKAIKFHQGYNLYNVGFTIGLIAAVHAAILRAFNFDLALGGDSEPKFHWIMVGIVVALSLISIAAAVIIDKKGIANYKYLIDSTGILPSDYVDDYGMSATLFNVGVMGVFSLVGVFLLGAHIHGPLMGAILTVMGFGAFGKHPLNAWPVMVGAWLAVLLTPITLGVGPLIAIFFVTALAPIAGRYGIIVGLLAGFLHLVLTPYAYALQGGFDLYNNGFTAGFVGIIVAPIAEAIYPRFKRRNVKEVKTKRRRRLQGRGVKV
ncbi:MAG: DUF1576 domain-containing protein [Acholeplasmataceae bacterium]